MHAQDRTYNRIVRTAIAMGLGFALACGAAVAKADKLAPADYLRPVPPPAAQAPHAPKATWTCGAWVELHQGRGKGRDCQVAK